MGPVGDDPSDAAEPRGPALARAARERDALAPVVLERMADVAPVGMVHADLEGNLLWVNEHWREITGHDPDLPAPMADLLGEVHPDHRQAVLELHERLGTGSDRSGTGDGGWTSGPVTTDVAFVRPTDGALRHHRVRVWPVLDGAGRATSLVATVEDVTDLVEARQATHAARARYGRLLLDAPVPQVLSELDGTIVEANPAFLDLLGVTAEELAALPSTDLFLPEDLEGMGLQVQRLVDGEASTFSVEQRLRRPDGAEVWVSGATTIIDEGGRRLLHSAMQDTTDRHLAEEALRTSEARSRAVLESLHEAVVVYDRDKVVIHNRAASEITGIPRDRVGDREAWRATDPIHPDGTPMGLDEGPSSRAMRTGLPVRDQLVGWNHPQGGRRWLLSSATPLVEGDEVTSVVLSFSDVTERKEAEDARRASEERYRHLVEHAPMGYLVLDREGTIVESNRAAEVLLGRPRDELVGTLAVAHVHPDDRAPIRTHAEALWDGEITRFESEHRLALPGQPHRWVSIAATLTPEMDTGRSFLVLLRDVDERRRAVEETTRLAHIVESTSDLVGLVDAPTGKLLYLNRAAREVAGVGDRDVTEMHYLDLFAEHAGDGGGPPADLLDVPGLAEGRGWSGEVAMRRGDGSVIQVWQTLTPELDDDGRPTRISALGRDVTARRILEQELAYQASHDSLTGLPNRSHLLELLEELLAHEGLPHHEVVGPDGRTLDGGQVRGEVPPGGPRTVAVLFLDLDRFKQVNDTLGHEAGDELLSEVARRISGVLRPGDTVARLGGDEFVLLCPAVADEAQARNLAQRIVAAVESRPIELGASRVRVTVSVGIALSRGGGHPEALLRDADAAMYRAKELGRARLEVFDDALRSRAAERSRRADELAIGIESGEIVVVYQPAIDLVTGEVVAVEALARWNHPRLGLLPPSEFIGLAEDTGLIVGLGLRVLTQACAQARRWSDDPDEGPDVHVNVSARQLATPSLPRLVEGVLASTGLSPRRLCLEMTESVLMEDAAGTVGALGALADVGVRLAIDDFGTGYSSLAYLRRFPVDVLKVDRSFVDELGHEPGASTIVAAIVNLASTLDLDAIAEGVETEEQRDGLLALGYRAAQGYLFSRPVPAEEIARLVHHRWTV